MEEKFMREAIRLARQGMEAGEGGPFGCVIVKNGEIIGRGNNQVTSRHDPTAHAEIVAIRNACSHLDYFQLIGCDLYTSCEPCPMCLGAIYWARPARVYYACSREDAARINFDDQYIYDEISKDLADRHIPMQQFLQHEALPVFEAWASKPDKTIY